MKKDALKLWFTDFWPEFEPTKSLFVRLLAQRYEVQLSERRPDLIIYSAFGTQYHKYTCPRVFYTGENRRPDWRECDFALSFDFSDHPRHFRLPLYALHDEDIGGLLGRKGPPEAVLRAKTKFCCAVVSNADGPERNRFFHLLSRYKRVDSGGRWNNNVGGPVADKLAFIKDYKFALAFENSSHPGYTTEKIFQPMLVRSVPVYWGNPLVRLDFNPRSFVNCHDFGSFEEAVERVIAADRDDALYLQYLREPNFTGDTVNPYADPRNLQAFLFRVVEELPRLSPLTRACRRSSGWLKRAARYAYGPAKTLRRRLHS
jgi:alpha(1,3/1,4) fucosyltransferase